MPLPEWLIQFGNRCAADAGLKVEAAETGLTVHLRGRTVQVDPDRDDPGRVAVWVELQPPAGMPDTQVAAAAVRYTADTLIQTGCAMGFNPKARLVLLGRSMEREALAPGQEMPVLDRMLAEVAAADAALGSPSTRPRAG